MSSGKLAPERFRIRHGSAAREVGAYERRRGAVQHFSSLDQGTRRARALPVQDARDHRSREEAAVGFAEKRLGLRVPAPSEDRHLERWVGEAQRDREEPPEARRHLLDTAHLPTHDFPRGPNPLVVAKQPTEPEL